MELSEFNNYSLSNLLETLFNENKTVILLEHFNADLLKYDKDSNKSDVLDMYSNLLLPLIASPTRVTTKSRTIIDNIFSNNYDFRELGNNVVWSACPISVNGISNRGYR